MKLSSFMTPEGDRIFQIKMEREDMFRLYSAKWFPRNPANLLNTPVSHNLSVWDPVDLEKSLLYMADMVRELKDQMDRKRVGEFQIMSTGFQGDGVLGPDKE